MPTPPRSNRPQSKPAEPEVSQSIIDIHRGEALWSFANTYPSLLLTLIEAMQNGIDNDATAIFVTVDLKERKVVIADNGKGTDRDGFETALASVGKSIKATNKLGRFGRGLISPLNKCKSFTFVSEPIGRRKVGQWTFRGEEIRQQHFNLTIPYQELPAMPVIIRRYREFLTGPFDTKWRTMVSLNGVIENKVISLVDLDELESQVRTKLGPAMRKHGVVIRVVLTDEKGRTQFRDINPIAFSGEPLPPVVYIDQDAGEVQFELFRAEKHGGKRKGVVSVMELDGNYPIPMGEFVRQARGRQWAGGLEEAFKALTSGYFEGFIKCKHIELHAERTKFEFNDALMGLYLTISTWFEECGEAYYQNEQEESRESRYQDLGRRSVDHLRELLQRPEFTRLWE